MVSIQTVASIVIKVFKLVSGTDLVSGSRVKGWIDVMGFCGVLG